MAKIVKDTREVMDIDEELNKLASEKKHSKSKKPDDKENIKKVEKQKKTKNQKNKKNAKKVKKHSKVVTFFKEVRSEISKVKWPSKKDMIKYSIATIVFIIFFALFFYLIDLIIALLKAGV